MSTRVEIGRSPIEQRSRCFFAQAAQLHHVEAGSLAELFSRGKDENDRLKLHPARDEEQHVARRSIEPVGILHEHDQWRVVRHLCQQIKRGKRDEERVRRRTVSKSECGLYRATVTVGKPIELVESRPKEPVKTRKRKTGFGLNATCRQNTKLAVDRGSARHL